jgi:hypothetical protein
VRFFVRRFIMHSAATAESLQEGRGDQMLPMPSATVSARELKKNCNATVTSFAGRENQREGLLHEGERRGKKSMRQNQMFRRRTTRGGSSATK